jgi:hypothetical protein
MHPLMQTILLTVFVPSVVAGVFLLIATWVPPGRWRSGVVAAGLATAWCAGSWLAVRSPRWPALQAADWQFYAVAVAGVVALITSLWGLTRAWRWVAGFVFFSVFFAVLLQRVLAGLWPGPGVFVWPLGLAALALVNAGAVRRIGHSVQAAWTFLAMLVFAVLMSAALTASGAASLGHGCGLLASACGGLLLISCVWRRQLDLAPAALVVAVIVGGLLVQGVFFAGLKPVAALLVGVAWPAAAAVAWLLRHGSGVFRAGFVTATVAVCGAVALWLASRS